MIYAALIRVAWAMAYAVALVVLYGWLDPLRTDAGSNPWLFALSLAAGVLVIVLARRSRA